MNDTQVIDTLHALAAIPLGAGGLPRLLDEITEAAIEMAEADLGDLRLLDPASSRLRIAAQRGFPARWTEFWNASPDDGTSGQALRARKRMIVEDVFHSPSHADERTRGMLLQAGVRAVQSTPLVTRSGEVLGVVSTYMCRPHRPAPRTLRWLDLLARQASDLVENVSATAARHDAVRRFGALVAATPGVAWSTGPDWSRIDALKGPPCAAAAQAGDRDWLEHCVDPADRSRASVAIEAAIRARGPFGLQLRTRRADGSTGWSRSRAAPVLDAQDRIVEWIGTVVNATQSGQAGDPPFHERERLRSVLETLPVGVFLADSADCTRVSGNAALLAWLGASEGDNLSPQAPEPDAYGRRIAYAAAGEPLAAADLPMQRAAREGRSVGPVRLDVRLPDGRERVAQVCAAPIRDAGGDVGGAVAVYMDVTEFSAAAEVGEQARHQDELLAEVSHELRNPLAAISSAVDMLADDLANARQTMEQLIRGQVGILGRLVDDLLDVSRTTLNGSAVLRKEDVSLRQLLENAAGAARAAIARRSQQLAVEPPPPDLRFRADGVRLQQVLVNLLDNASKYGGEGVHIRLSGDLEGSEIVLRCDDDGAGIDPTVQDRIFEPLVRSDSARAVEPGGMGLGLPLVRRLAQLHGGSAHIVSKGHGQGSRFEVRIPFEGSSAEAAAAVAAPPAIRGPTPRGLAVAVIDDHPDVARTLGLALERAGHRVIRYADGPSALAGMRETLPEAAIVDTRLPGMNGFELLGVMREDPRLRDVRVIGVSGAVDPALRGNGPRFDAFLMKPVDIQQLLRLLGGGDGPPIRALLVEDHSALRAVTTDLLRAERFEPVAVSSAAEALEAAGRVRPQLLLCDMNLPDMPGLALIGRLQPQLRQWGTYVAVVTALPEGEIQSFARNAESLGVDAFIAKPLTARWLRDVAARLQATHGAPAGRVPSDRR